MRRHIPILSTCLLISGSATAATGNINFSGTVASTCALTVTNATGVMMPSTNLKELTSKNGGGAAGTITLTTTGGVNMSIDTVISETHPAADATTTTWVPTYTMTGVQTVAETAGSTNITSNGTGTINVHLTGTKSGSDTFRNGTYTAVVVVRCEP